MRHFIQDKTLTLKLEGKLIMSNSDKTKNQIKEAINQLVKEDNINCVAIDLEAVDFIDSTGVGVFISIYKFTGERGLGLKLIKPCEIVKKVFTITKINTIIAIE